MTIQPFKSYANASAAAARVTQLDNKSSNWLTEGNLLQMQGMYSDAIAKYNPALYPWTHRTRIPCARKGSR